MSLNNHECLHNKFTGPVEITPGNLNYEDIDAKFTTTNTNILLSSVVDTNLEPDENNNIPISSSILFIGNTDQFRLKFVSYHNAKNGTYAEIATGDNSREPIYVRQYFGTADENDIDNPFYTFRETLALLDSNGNTRIPRDLYITGNVYKYNPSDNTRQLVNFSLGPKEAMPYEVIYT